MPSCVYLPIWIFLLFLIKSSCSVTTEKPTSISDQSGAEYRQENNELDKARRQLQTDREKFEREKREMQRSVDKTDVIRLNVGGELLMTTRATLTCVPKSVLATIFNGRWEHKLNRDQNGNIFLDFNSVLFRHLLDQLRVLRNDDPLIFYPPSSSSLVVAFEKMLQKLGLDALLKSAEAVITFDVGGERVTTRHKTLSRVPKLKFSSSNTTSANFNENQFLDYAPKLFRHLLEQLREEKETSATFYKSPSNEKRDAFNAMLIDLGFENSTTIINNASKRELLPTSKWTQNGETVAGDRSLGNELNQLFHPYSVYVDDDDQTIYVADYHNHRIMEWKYGATSGQVVAGGNGQGDRDDQFDYPSNVIVDKGTDSLIICDTGNRRVMRWPRRDGTNGEMIIFDINSRGLTMDGDGFLYVSDVERHEVRRWQIGVNEQTLVAGGNGYGQRLDQLYQPTFIYVDRDRALYVTDYSNNRVMMWVKDATQGVVVAGGQGQGHALTQLYSPYGLIVDQLSTVYVADHANHRIMRWCKGATEGSVVVGGNGHGGQANHLYGPTGLAFDLEGNLYVVDFYNHRVQKFLLAEL